MGGHSSKSQGASKDFSVKARDAKPYDRCVIMIVALDYIKTAQPDSCPELTCPEDALNLIDLAVNCGQGDNIWVLTDVAEDHPLYAWSAWPGTVPTKANAQAMMQQIAADLTPSDCFILFYAGHGLGVDDENGDEADGQDEAFALLNDDYSMDWDSIWIDDDFTAFLVDNTPGTTPLICITDCCHSGSIVDLNHYVDVQYVQDRAIVAISGAKDTQTAKETSQGGGVATHCLLQAVGNLDALQKSPYAVAGVFDEMRQIMTDEGYNSPDSDQNLVISRTKRCPEFSLLWPLSTTFPLGVDPNGPKTRAVKLGGSKPAPSKARAVPAAAPSPAVATAPPAPYYPGVYPGGYPGGYGAPPAPASSYPGYPVAYGAPPASFVSPRPYGYM